MNSQLSGRTAERGEAYIETMRDPAETRCDLALHEHHVQELDRIIRPFDRMSAHELNQVFEGIHHGLETLLDELIAGRTAHFSNRRTSGRQLTPS